MAITRTASQDATGTSLTTSVSATYAATPTSGDLLVAAVLDNGAGINTTIPGWTSAKNSQSSASAETWVFYKVSNGTESTTVSANNSGAGIMEIAIYEYTGFAGTPTLDQTALGSGGLGATSVNTGTTPTTTAANELLFVEAGTFGNASTSPSWNNSFTLVSNNPGVTTALFTGQQIVSATGAYTSTVSYTGASNFPSAIIASFKGVPVAQTSNTVPILAIGALI